MNSLIMLPLPGPRLVRTASSRLTLLKQLCSGFWSTFACLCWAVQHLVQSAIMFMVHAKYSETADTCSHTANVLSCFHEFLMLVLEYLIPLALFIEVGCYFGCDMLATSRTQLVVVAGTGPVESKPQLSTHSASYNMGDTWSQQAIGSMRCES